MTFPVSRFPRPSASPLGFPVLAALAALLAACPNAGEDRLLSVEATGVVKGFVYFDRNGSRAPESPQDTILRGVEVHLLARGTIDTLASATSDTGGEFRFADLPVGGYVVLVNAAAVAGDSLLVTRVDTGALSLSPADSLTVRIALGFPQVTVRAARALAPGRKVFVVGVALNNRAAFGDSTVHFADTSGAIRATRVRSAFVVARDSLRMRGTTSARDGQPTLDDVTVFPLGLNAAVVAQNVSTTLAAAADGGLLDAALVRVVNASVQDTATVAGGYRVTVDDGSGPLDVRLDSAAFGGGFPPGIGIVGNVFSFTGVLVPTGAGAWQLRPRGAADVAEQVPQVTITQARALAAGSKVFVNGVALTEVFSANPGGTFGDTTLHIADNAAAIRLVGLRGNVTIADSLRIFGVVGSRDGQPALTEPSVVSLLRIGANVQALLRTLSTAQAASANGGVADAALVRVLNAAVQDTATIPGAYRVTVSDNSGPLQVRLDSVTFAGGFPVGVDSIGARFDIIGVLVPAGSAWQLRPRRRADFTLRP